MLQERQKWLKVHRNAQIGDIVLVADNSPRSTWNMARVIDVQKDKQGLVRVVKIKTKTSVVERPVDKLVLVLESKKNSATD